VLFYHLDEWSIANVVNAYLRRKTMPEKKELTDEEKGAHGTCEVVQIADPSAPGGFVEINKSDFDEKKHKLYVAPKAAKGDKESDEGDSDPDTEKSAEKPKKAKK